MDKIEVPIIAQDEELIPVYGSDEAAGADVRAFLTEAVEIGVGESVCIPTGIRLEIPNGFEVQVRPRSGLAFKHGVTVLNTPGTIDSDYRGEVGVILINHGKEPFVVEPKMRIAQLVLAPVFQAMFTVETALAASKRGEGGFGHTGTH
ncbi:MAG: Deoxyuridine 5'-triphosphate nucleotidohydrolase [Chlamydiia bacterium]|nr:Deoxyuridine 5'-triphosphate nucleotidohydrolase [Chlamydiia bacterium]MCH9614996.1 Deoxyuridine 5'-triphosphate nucleotidohydrolase [Chlamydiia bacterium]MCH9629954.1 Deoxyuridine 5'-triphosphate nucleotidohydrolase [Chlamydiia bacterium]